VTFGCCKSHPGTPQRAFSPVSPPLDHKTPLLNWEEHGHLTQSVFFCGEKMKATYKSITPFGDSSTYFRGPELEKELFSQFFNIFLKKTSLLNKSQGW
jgi:hypothetical protein